MAFNGSGVFNRLYNWVTDRNGGVKIQATRMDAEMDGFATGLSQCITKDGQTTITSNIPFNGQKITGLGDASAGQDALNKRTADAAYLALAGGTMTGPFKTTAQTVSASAVDCSLGNYFTKTASGPLTWSFTNAPSDVFEFQLELTNGGTGTQTWPASVAWMSGSAPTLQTSGKNLLTFTTSNGGSIWMGSYDLTPAASSGGTVTSVALSGGTTGLTSSGGPITGSGTLTLGGTLGVANGGTGSTTASAARSALGLGTVATQDASNVNITGGSVSGISISGLGTISVTGVSSSGGISATTGSFSGNVSGSAFSGSSMSITSGNVYGFGGTTTGTYGNAGSTVGWEISGTPIFSCTSNSLNAASSVLQASCYFGTAWTNISDQRTKKDIANYTVGLSAIKQLQPRTFKYNGVNGTPNDNRTRVGFIAQELQATDLDAMVIDDLAHPGFYSVNTNDLIFTLVNAVKELDARIATLEAAP